MSNSNALVRIALQLLRAFCGGSEKQQLQPQNQQQNQHHNQQQQQPYPHQQQYPQQPYNQCQSQPPQHIPPQQTWSKVAGHQDQYLNQPLNGQYPSHPPNAQYLSQPSNGQYPSHQNGQYISQQNGQYPSKPYGIPAGGVVGPHHPSYQNQDMVNATNARYTDLRNQARREGEEADKFFAQSQQAYKSGDGQRAHDLSMQGKVHDKRHDELDDEASAWIFSENNKQSPPGTIDLHGLYVKEATERTEAAISQAQSSGQTELRVIVGKGIHSQGHVARIKPAVEELMQKYSLSAHLDPHNTGVLIVNLAGEGGHGRTRDAGGLVDQIGRQQEGDCVIM